MADRAAFIVCNEQIRSRNGNARRSTNTVISEGFTNAPEVVYLAIVLEPVETKRSDPETSRAKGLSKPVMSAAFTSCPLVVYLRIVSEPNTNRFDPDTAIPALPNNPDINDVFTGVPSSLYLPRIPLLTLMTNRLDSETAINSGVSNPAEISEALTGLPSRLYSQSRHCLFRRQERFARERLRE